MPILCFYLAAMVRDKLSPKIFISRAAVSMSHDLYKKSFFFSLNNNLFFKEISTYYIMRILEFISNYSLKERDKWSKGSARWASLIVTHSSDARGEREKERGAQKARQGKYYKREMIHICPPPPSPTFGAGEPRERKMGAQSAPLPSRPSAPRARSTNELSD